MDSVSQPDIQSAIGKNIFDANMTTSENALIKKERDVTPW